jgi:hypothetical protein
MPFSPSPIAGQLIYVLSSKIPATRGANFGISIYLQLLKLTVGSDE